MRPQFTVFIPVLNEEAIIEANTRLLVDRLRAQGRSFELLIGSNGSSDRTEELGRVLESEIDEVRFFALDQKGPGRAFAKAIELFRGDWLITLDMDLSTDLGFLDSSLELLRQYAVVVGSKHQGTQERSLGRIMGSGLYIACARLMLGMPYHDYSLGAKAFHRQVLERFRESVDTHTAYVSNMVFCAHRAGFPIYELPVTCADRRVSRFNLGHEGLYRLKWVAWLFWQTRLLGRFPPRA